MTSSYQYLGPRPVLRLELMQRLLSAAKVGNQDTVRSIVEESRGNPLARPYINDALILASCFGHVEIVRQLLRVKAEVTYSDSSGLRAIHHAATSGNAEVTKMLLNAGSPVNNVDNDGFTPLHHAIESGHAGVVALLVREGAAISRPKNYTNGEAPIHCAARRGRKDMIETLLTKDPNLDVLTKDTSQSPLHLAVAGRHFGVVTALCHAGAIVNLHNGNGESPLHVAVSNSSVGCVRILLDYGADPCKADTHCRTPLHIVAASTATGPTSLEIVQMLLKDGASVNGRDSDGCTALHFAASTGNTDVTAVLVAEGASLNMPGKGGDTPLHLAINYGRDDVARLLIEAGADVTVANWSDLTPLHQVPASRLTDKSGLADCLLRHGARVNVHCQRGSSPLDRCVFTNVLGKSNSKETLYRIVAAGAKLEKNTQVGGSTLRNSGLCWLTLHGELTAAGFLVNSGWDMTKETWIHLKGKNQEIESFLVWLRDLNNNARPLKVICRSVIRDHLQDLSDDRDIVPALEQLPVPNLVKRFLTLDTEITYTPSSPDCVGLQHLALKS